MKKWKNTNGWKIIFRNDSIQVFRPFGSAQWITIVLAAVLIVVYWQFSGLNKSQDWGLLFWGLILCIVVTVVLSVFFTPFTLIRKWELRSSPSSIGFQPIESVSLTLDGNDIALINAATSTLIWKGGNDEEMTRQIYESLSQFLSEKMTQHTT